MNATPTHRVKRVEELLRAQLADVLRRELDDPLFASIVIVSVAVSDDLSHARIGVRILSESGSAAERKNLERSLARARGRIGRAVAPRLDLRRSPELLFFYDTGRDAAYRVNELLQEIAEEPKGSSE